MYEGQSITGTKYNVKNFSTIVYPIGTEEREFGVFKRLRLGYEGRGSNDDMSCIDCFRERKT